MISPKLKFAWRLASLPPNSVGNPTQIAYYSTFPRENDYEYRCQSQDALRLFDPPRDSFSLGKAIDETAFWETASLLDKLPQLGLEPVIDSCKEAGYDLHDANIITKRGVVFECVLPGFIDRGLTRFDPACPCHWA
jgi:hypothetical protein